MTHANHTIIHKKPVPDLLNHNDLSGWNPTTNYSGHFVAGNTIPNDSWATEWLAAQLAKIPEEFHAGIQAKYRALSESGKTPSEGLRKANQYILETLDLFAAFAHKRLESHEHKARVAALQVQLFGLDAAVRWAREQGVNVPRFPKDEPDADPTKRNSRAAVTKRLCNPDWWESQLTKKFRRDAEAVQIRAGNVCKGVSPYVSAQSLAAYKERLAVTEEWKKQAVLVSDEGDEISMDSTDHQHSAAFIRFAEFMVRVNGMSAIAEESYLSADTIALLPDALKMGSGGALADTHHLEAVPNDGVMIQVCFTFTTSSRFHRYTMRNGKMVLNKKYDATTTPADARDWLQETWKLTQTAWKRKTKHIQPIQGFGFRMDESHHDGVSHYHYAIWVKASDAQRATEIFYNKALRGEYTDCVKKRTACQFGKVQDATEKGAAARRLNFKVMTNAKGMVSYMVKYITKGLTGADWEDLKAGANSHDTFLNLMARKSVWGLRQYAFWNAPSVMAWRELRRMNDVIEDVDFEAARLAAKAGDWKTFTELNGGATCGARQRPIRLIRKLRTEFAANSMQSNAVLNQYGEVVEQICGIARGEVERYTRLKDWYLLNVGSMKQLLINQFLREADMPKAAMPASFSNDIQAVIDQAKAKGKLSRLADKAGIVMFRPPPTAESSRAKHLPLGLVGITSHEIHEP